MLHRFALALGFIATLIAAPRSQASGLNSTDAASGSGVISRPMVSRLAPPATGIGNTQVSRSALDIPRGDPLIDPLNLSAAERQLMASAAGRQFDRRDLFDAALIACGLNDPAAAERYRQIVNRMRAAINIDDGNELAAIYQIHHALHRQLLRSYDANATDLMTTLDTGVYNCASATILFIALADEVGLNANAIEMPGHVRVEVSSAHERYEVEVTCPTWADAVRHSPSPVANGPIAEPSPRGRGQGEGADNGGKNGALSPVLSHGGTDRRELTALGVIAMIYYNRGIDAFYSGRYADAVIANRCALLLDPENRAAQGNLLAAINNWALALSDAGRFSEAESLLAAGLRFDPMHTAFIHNAAHVRKFQFQSN